MLDVEKTLQAYMSTAIWSSSDHNDVPLDHNYDTDDISFGSKENMRDDVKAFLEANEADLEGAEEEQAGQDFWLTRNRHGAGFWDGDWPKDIGQRLTDSSHGYGECHLWASEMGELHYSEG